MINLVFCGVMQNVTRLMVLTQFWVYTELVHASATKSSPMYILMNKTLKMLLFFKFSVLRNKQIVDLSTEKKEKKNTARTCEFQSADPGVQLNYTENWAGVEWKCFTMSARTVGLQKNAWAWNQACVYRTISIHRSLTWGEISQHGTTACLPHNQNFSCNTTKLIKNINTFGVYSSRQVPLRCKSTISGGA